jgi:UDP-N-acetylglucosamine--N-acetylmuramyl-(pentapeptide) pyrophosphoryl-undecaprenol N-acetylglucosamine transferase
MSPKRFWRGLTLHFRQVLAALRNSCRVNPLQKRLPGIDILILAGGTGGHIFPALAVAEGLRAQGRSVGWMGTPTGMEADIVARAGFNFFPIPIQNLRGKGLIQHLTLPGRLCRAFLQARRILREKRPQVVLGFGGYAAGPGGLAAAFLRIPLLIHEQNAVPGLTNRCLARVAQKVLTGFPQSFGSLKKAVYTGNPLRTGLVPAETSVYQVHAPLRLLVIGGSSGARVLNETVPAALALLPEALRPALWQQTGTRTFAETQQKILALGLNAKVTAFIEDMAEAYAWADIILCRAGALTLAELALLGKPAIFVPLPTAADDHQRKNAQYFTTQGAGCLLLQADFTAKTTAQLLEALSQAPERLQEMARAMKRLAKGDATRVVIALAEELMLH